MRLAATDEGEAFGWCGFEELTGIGPSGPAHRVVDQDTGGPEFTPGVDDRCLQGIRLAEVELPADCVGTAFLCLNCGLLGCLAIGADPLDQLRLGGSAWVVPGCRWMSTVRGQTLLANRLVASIMRSVISAPPWLSLIYI